MSAPVLVFAYGNPSRGDDALGPAFADELATRYEEPLARGELEVLTDFQLQVEHVLDLQGRRRVYFVDAAASGPAVSLEPVEPKADESAGSHHLSPAALLHAHSRLAIGDPPECRVLAIRGESFELGEPLSPAAREHLEQALRLFDASWGTVAGSVSIAPQPPFGHLLPEEKG